MGLRSCLVVTLLASSIAGLAFAQSKTGTKKPVAATAKPKGSPVAPSAPANTVSKAVWIDSMTTAIPTAFCSEQQYFRVCFDVSEDECLNAVRRAVKSCLNKYDAQFPAVFKQPEDGTLWGTKVGACTGTAYEAALSTKKRKTLAQCNAPQPK